MTTVLVTGSSGFIGRNLCRALRARGDKVLEWDRVGWDGERHVSMDLHEPTDSMRARFSSVVEKADQVYHLAGNADVGAFDRVASLMGREWAMAANVIASCQTWQKPLVVASSAYAKNANTGYGRTKRGIEELAWLAGMPGLSSKPGLSVARLYNIYGPGQEKAITYTSAVVLNLYRSFKKGDWSLRHPSAKRDFVFLDDGIAGLLAIMEKTDGGESSNWDIASGEMITVRQLGSTMARLMGRDVLGGPEHEECENPPYLEPGYPLVPPKVSLEEGLRRTIAAIEETT